MFAQKSNNDSSIFHQLTPVAYLLIEMSTENQALRAKYVKQNLGELEGEIYKFWIPPLSTTELKRKSSWKKNSAPSSLSAEPNRNLYTTPPKYSRIWQKKKKKFQVPTKHIPKITHILAQKKNPQTSTNLKELQFYRVGWL